MRLIIVLIVIILSSISFADIADPGFEDSSDSAELRSDSPGQDWYLCMGSPELLNLDTFDIEANPTKKARLDLKDDVRLCQDIPPITGRFMAEWDVFVDWSDYPKDASAAVAHILLGDFLAMQLYKARDTMELHIFDYSYDSVLIEKDIDPEKWHTIKVIGNLDADLMDIYLNDRLVAEKISSTNSVNEIEDIRFIHTIDMLQIQEPVSIYIDNVYIYDDFEFTLDITIDGSGSVFFYPDKKTYTLDEVVMLSAVPQDGWVFDSWSGDVTGDEDNITLTMDKDMKITAYFKQQIPLSITLLASIILIMLAIVIYIIRKVK